MDDEEEEKVEEEEIGGGWLEWCLRRGFQWIIPIYKIYHHRTISEVAFSCQ